MSEITAEEYDIEKMAEEFIETAKHYLKEALAIGEK